MACCANAFLALRSTSSAAPRPGAGWPNARAQPDTGTCDDARHAGSRDDGPEFARPAEVRTRQDDLAGALDMLLADGALGVLRRFRPDGAVLRLAASLAQRPQVVSQQAAVLGGGAGQDRDRFVTAGAWAQGPQVRRPGLEPEPRCSSACCRRTWRPARPQPSSWPAQTSTGGTANGCASCSTNLIAAASPSNNPLLNPAAIKTLVDTGGISALRGHPGPGYRHGDRSARPGHGRAGGLRSRPRSRGDARLGRLPHRDASS